MRRKVVKALGQFWMLRTLCFGHNGSHYHLTETDGIFVSEFFFVGIIRINFYAAAGFANYRSDFKDHRSAVFFTYLEGLYHKVFGFLAIAWLQYRNVKHIPVMTAIVVIVASNSAHIIANHQY